MVEDCILDFVIWYLGEEWGHFGALFALLNATYSTSFQLSRASGIQALYSVNRPYTITKFSLYW